MSEFLSGILISYRLAVNKIKKLGAISEETAKKPKELGIEEWVLKNLVKGGVWGVKQTPDGRYYVECTDRKHCKGS